MYDDLHYWLVIGTDLNTTSLVDDSAFGISTDFVIAVPEITDSVSYVFRVKNIENGV